MRGKRESRETAKHYGETILTTGMSLFKTLQTKRRLFLKAQRLMKNVANFVANGRRGVFEDGGDYQDLKISLKRF